MIHYLHLLLSVIVVSAIHFNGGTIRWMPVDPHDNSSTIPITITQFYSWTYPTITCTTDVPISTSGRSGQNADLTCVTDCSTDGGYTTNPVNILTDCTSVSSSLGIMTSQRSVNITLFADAHFYLAYVGSAWVALNNPAKSGLQWSIVTFIDLRMRSDGFINTPPVASVVSPQYAIVNRTTQIQILASDANVGDDVRCRWSTYTPGYRRRKRSAVKEHSNERNPAQIYTKLIEDEKIIYREKKAVPSPPDPCANCYSTCMRSCPCTCIGCTGTSCSGQKCMQKPSCPAGTTAIGATIGTTTVETPGTLQPTSSYPNRQALDECGGICYPSSMPNGTILSGCTLFFQGLVPGTWYAAAIQVEDFINETSMTPMSSVPVQFLIYVMSEPICSEAPVFIPLESCLEVTVGVSISFDIFVLNLCDPNIADIADIVVSSGSIGIQIANLTTSSTNASLAYVIFTWTPQFNQIGRQQLCMIAYTDESVQSTQYCVTFMVITSSEPCKTTTTTSTTASTATTTTSSTTITTDTSTTTTVTSATTSTTASFTTVTSARTSTLSISTTMTSTSTTTTSIIIVAATTITSTPGKGTSWGLIAGISSLALPLALCSCWCPLSTFVLQVVDIITADFFLLTFGFTVRLYDTMIRKTIQDNTEFSSREFMENTFILKELIFIRSPAAKRHRQEEEENRWRYSNLTSSTNSMLRTTTSGASETPQIEVPKKSYRVCNILTKENNANRNGSTLDGQGSILISIYNNTNGRRTNSLRTTEESIEMGNAWMRPLTSEAINNDVPNARRVTSGTFSKDEMSSFNAANENFDSRHYFEDRENVSAFSTSSFDNDRFDISQSRLEPTSETGRSHSSGTGLSNFKDWTRMYLFGSEHKTGISSVQRPS